MTMRLQLVIEGDPSGAKKALEETGRAVEDLGRKSGQASGELESTGGAAEAAAGGLGAAGDAAERAAKGIAASAEAARDARPNLSVLSATLIGLAAGVGAAAISEGFKVALGAAQQFFKEVTDGRAGVERALENHAELVKRIRGAYSEAAGAASSYGLTATPVLRFDAQQSVARMEDAYRAELSNLEDSGFFAPIMQAHRGREYMGPFFEAISRARQEMKDGTLDAIELRKEISAIAEGLPRDDLENRAVGERIRAQIEDAAQTKAELERARDVLKAVEGNAEAAAAALGGSAERYREIGGSAGEAAETISGSADAITRSGEAAAGALPALREYDDRLRSVAANGGNPAFTSPARAALTPLTAGQGFASGGYTGDGMVSDVAGVVHAREFVVNAESTARHRPLLEAINAGLPGYASGGYVNPVLPMAGGTAARSGGYASTGYDILRGAARGVIVEVLSMARADDFSGFWDLFERAGLSIADRLFSHWAGVIADSLVNALSPAAGGSGSGMVGSLLSGLFGSGTGYFPAAPAMGFHTLHDGGIVGRDSGGLRFAPPQVFIDAPRLHSGGILAPGERPIIAMEGEEVGWPDQLARKYRGGDVSIVVNNYSSAKVDTQEGDDGNGGRRVTFVLEDAQAAGINRPGSAPQRALRAMGVAPRVVRT